MRRRKSKLPKAEQLNRDIARWEARQDAATAMLQKSGRELLKLRKQRQRELARATRVMMATATQVESTPAPVEPPSVISEDGSTIYTRVEAKPKADEDIPTWLDRTMANDKDAAARAEIKAEQEAEKKRKAERRIEKLKISQETKHAELTGQRRKMPLTGKAALQAITAREDQTARMETLGFRKSGRRK